MNKSEIKKADEGAIIRQSSEIVEANYKLTAAEQKVILNFIAQIDTSDKDLYKYRISVKSLSDACGFNAKSGYRQLQYVIKKLLNRSLIIQRRDGTGWYGSHWVQSCDYVKNEKDGDCSYVEFELDKRLCEHFLQLKERFLKTDLKSLIRFSHVYSTRFYMIFKNRIKLGYIRYSFDDLCKILELPKAYKQKTADLKSKVIKVAVDEINEESDIMVEYEYYKDGGRAHVGVDFKFYNKAMKQIKPVSENPVKRTPLTENEQIMYDRLTNPETWDITDDVARKLMKKYPLERIDLNIKYAWDYKKNKGGLGGWLISCIEQDHAKNKEERKKKRLEEKRKKKEQARERADMAMEGLFATPGTADDVVAKQYEVDKQREIKEDTSGKLSEVIASMIIKQGETITGLARAQMESRGLTVADVVAGKR